MGVFRLILAAAVVIAHSAPVPWLPLVNGGLAVKLFFMVSGFYMALILSGKYHCPKGIWLFYSNRFLRIFPIYWLVLVLELLLEWNWPALAANGGALGLHRDVLHSAGPGALVALLASEVGLLGNEVFSLLGWLPGHGWEVWSSNASEASLRGWKVIFMPHAWTLGCEVAFYLVAPWMNRWRTQWLILLVVCNILIALFLNHLVDPRLAEVMCDYWAPLQMGFFASGMLAWRMLVWCPHLFAGKKAGGLIIGLASVTFGFDLLSHMSNRGSLGLLFLVTALGIPALFQATRSIRWDRLVGDLSYPVYLCHLLVIRALHEVSSHWLRTDFLTTPWFPISAIILSCVFAWILAAFLEHPLDQLRQRRLVA